MKENTNGLAVHIDDGPKSLNETTTQQKEGKETCNWQEKAPRRPMGGMHTDCTVTHAY